MTDRSRAFRAAGERLGAAGLRFDDVIRTWLYLGDITGPEGKTHRYYELNRARTEFYRDRKFGAGMVHALQSNGRVFPASTGIGTGGERRGDQLHRAADRPARRRLVPLENPQQTSSCDYGRSYGTESPKFARAMAVVAGEFVTTLISGTASITASETRHPDDVERQTQQSLDNIEALIGPENFRAPRPARPGGDPRRSGLGPGVRQAAGGLCRRQGDLPGAAGRVAHHLRRGRYLSAGIVGGNRRHRLLATVPVGRCSW